MRIFLGDLTQRQVEKRAGLSRGYLSQLLYGNISLKFWHVLAILGALNVKPGDFFYDLYPRPGSRVPSLERFKRSSRRLEHPLRLELARLYGFGIESILDLRERLELCEDALAELQEVGLLNRAEK